MRIVSLLPSATEICCELGLSEQLVAVSHDCDWPPAIRGKPVISASEVDPAASSGEIDRQVRDRLHNGRSIYHLDQDRLQEFAPDVVFTQELCEVCAPSFDQVQRAAKLLDGETRVVSLEPSDLAGILDNVTTVGEVTGRVEAARALRQALETRIEAVRQRARSVSTCPRVLCLEWLDPVFLGGHWVPEMVELAGGRPLGRPGEHSRQIDWDEIRSFDPELILLMPCGFDARRALAEAHLLRLQPGWDSLAAVQRSAVYAVDGSAYFSRPGPRTVTGLELIARLLHPSAFKDLALPEHAVLAV